MMSVLAIGVGWAETIVFANLGLENGVQYLDPFDGGDFTVTFAGGANDGKYYDTGNGIRVYGGGTMTIAAKTGKITSITITFDGDNKPTTNNVVNVGAYDSSTGVWTGSASSVVFTRPSGSGHWRVKTISVIVGGTTIETVATPTFTPASGNYTEAQNVTINCATAGADIYWGYDGENFVSYDGSTILVNKTMTLYAYAMKSGMNNSAVAEANYTIKQLPNGAIFYESFDACDGLGGNDDKWNGNLTTTALASNILDNSGWGLLKAYPAKECARFGSSSDKGVATSPNINVVSGKVYALLFKAGAWNGSSENTDLIVTGLDEEGAPISVLYSDPSCSSVLSSVSMTKGAWTSYTVYIKPTTSKIKIEWSGEQAKNSRFFLDEVLLEEAVAPAVATPVIVGETPFLTSTEVTITCATEGATIYYTTNGDDPTTSSTLYSAPLTINATTTVKAIAVKNGQTSNIASKTFTAIPTIGSIEEFNALEPGDNFKYTASNLVAIKQYETTSTSGNKNYYLYAQYGEKGMLIFGNTGQTYQLGDVIPGGFTGTRAEFNGAPEMTNPAGFIASSQNVGLTPVEITPSQVNLDNFGRYAIIKNASFNTTNKIITAGDEEIPYHTTFMTPPTDGAVYDVIGICGYFKPNNGTAYPQFLPISATPAVTTGPDYYLVGTFNNWTEQDESYKFTARADGSYILNKTLTDDVSFKILKVEGEDVTWLGGGADGDYFGITKDVCTNISLVDGKNFYMAAGGNCTFTVSADQKLTVSKEAQLFMKGSYSNDDWSTKTPLEATNTGWTITMDFDANTQFGFVDEWGNWHGGNGYLIKAEHMGDEIPMVGNGNYVFENASNYTLNINSELTKLVVTDNNVVIEGDYVKVTSNDQLSSGIYLIVYEDGSLAFNGGLETLDAVGNSIEVEIDDNVIPATDDVDAAAFTYDAIAKSLKSASGYYIGQTTDANGLKASETVVYTNTITIDGDGNADVISQGGAHLRYNSNSDDIRFRYYKSSTYTAQKAIQLYKKGGEIVPTLDAPEIEGDTPFEGSTTVTITAEEGAAIYYTINGDTPSSESILYEEPFELSESATVKAIAIKGDLVSSVASKSFEKKPEISSATAFYRYEGTGEFVFTGELVAIAQTGKYLYAQDDAKGVLIYGEIDQTYDMGDKIPAGFHAKKGAYHGAPQMTDPTGLQEATEQVTIQPVELTIAQASLDTQDNLYRYAVIKEVKYEDGNLVAGDNSLFVYADRFETNLTPVEGKTYNVTGIVGWHDVAQFMPLEYELVQVPVVLEGVAFTAERKWATWCGDENLALPENVTAYVVTGINTAGTAVEVEAVNYIPANVGVLLYSETAAESVSAMPAEAGESVTSLLQGGPATISDAYVLYDNQFILAQDGTTVGAHRCYLPMTSEAQGAPRLLIGDPGTVTGIEDLRYDSNGKPVGYYDLTGRYIGTSLNGKRGIFITSDGKKVVR